MPTYIRERERVEMYFGCKMAKVREKWTTAHGTAMLSLRSHMKLTKPGGRQPDSGKINGVFNYSGKNIQQQWSPIGSHSTHVNALSL